MNSPRLLTTIYWMGCGDCGYEGYQVRVIWGPSPGNPGHGCAMWRCPVCGGHVKVKDWEKTRYANSTGN